jgi:hypothetical protein
MRVSHRPTTALTVLALALGISACAAPIQQPPPAAPPTPPTSLVSTPSPLPPRPTTLRLNGINPCDLFTPSQVAQHKTLDGLPESTENGPSCAWENYSIKPGNSWAADFVLTHGAEYYLGSTTGATQTQVDGFTAVSTTSALAENPEYQCLLYFDVAPGQSLEVSYQNLNGDYPGINHQLACQLAAKAAHLMLTNLRKLSHQPGA